MSSHVGVSCDICLRSNFEGKRFKCLICYDYDLCESCFSYDLVTPRHLGTHPVQCILTKNDLIKYYAGESINPENPSSLTCPLCSKRGFTQNLLYEHVSKEHASQDIEVLCPICAAQPSGDPNLVTRDILHHLSADHQLSQNTGDSSASRNFRRRGVRSRHFRNSYFTGPVVLSNNNSSSSNRDSSDPIAVLLSQLSSARRNIQHQINDVPSPNVQDITHISAERQQASDIREQVRLV